MELIELSSLQSNNGVLALWVWGGFRLCRGGLYGEIRACFDFGVVLVVDETLLEDNSSGSFWAWVESGVICTSSDLETGAITERFCTSTV